jgi:antitoxin component YwqK of YwqJK toxin-antitoxin module
MVTLLVLRQQGSASDSRVVLNKVRGSFLFLLLLATTLAAEEGVVRKTYVVRGQDYWVNVYYRGDKEIARVKETKDGVLEQTGKIPNGPVTFYDGMKNVLGEENYFNGKKEGTYRAYYDNGQLMVESEYDHGRLMTYKEYYPDGKLRLEANYEDAIEDAPGKEVGEGKIYFSNGALKYEWRFNRSDAVGFKRAFTEDGQIRFEAYYDKDGNVIGSNDVATP